MSRRTVPPAPPRTGMAALVVVMVLFFIMAMVAAYTNRNLVFEQRTTANSYRAERALVAADAGVDWAISMLNGGRIDINCQPSTNAADTDFRRRYLNRTSTGAYTLVGSTDDANTLYPGCISSAGNLTCICPTQAAPNPDPNPVRAWPIDGGGTAFRVRRWLPGLQTRSGSMLLEARGCATTGTGASSCVSANSLPAVDAQTQVRTTVGLVRAMASPPLAALTAAGAINAGTSELRIGNPDAASGLTAHAGAAITAAASSRYAGPAGSADDGRLANDAALQVPAVADRYTAADRLFRGTFGMDAPTFRRQPALVRIDCSGGCTTTQLTTALNNAPGRTLWLDGNLTIDTAPVTGVIGSNAEPVMAIVTGTLAVQAATELVGFVYATDIQWSGAASGALVRGALMAANGFSASATATIRYDADVLDVIRLGYGSFVRTPGSWGRPN